LAATIAIAALGGGVATLAGLPASWLSGAMITVTIATFAGLDTRLPVRLADVLFLLIGIALGSGVTPALVRGIAAWPISLAGLVLTVAACIVAVQLFLMRFAGWDRETAFYAAIPGALSYVLALAIETGADIRKVAASQSIRVFLLVAVLPGVVFAIEGGPPAGPTILEGTPVEIAILIAAALVGGLVFRRLRVPAAILTGSFVASAVLHGSAAVAGTLPEPVVIGSFVMLGALIGSRFIGTTLGLLRKILLASIGGFVIAATIAGVLAVVFAAITGVSVDQAIIAYAPGGLDAMMSLALALNMDSAFVAAHQFARFGGIALSLPFMARRVAVRAAIDRESESASPRSG
jgi:hypothetical protein